MPIPNSGQVAWSQIEIELTGLSNYEENINDVTVRLLASLGNNDGVVPTGTQIRWSDFYGKGVLKLTNSSSTTNYNIRTLANSNGYNGVYTAGKTLISFTNSGTVGATSTAAYALDTGTFTSGDKVSITNTTGAFIVGAGGAGGGGGTAFGNGDNPSFGLFCGSPTASGGSPGGAGGPAMRVQFITSVINNGLIAGGGNGGTGGGGGYDSPTVTFNGYGGGGGGGGAGSNAGGGAGGGQGWRTESGGTFASGYFCDPPTLLNVGTSGGSGSITTGGSGGLSAGGTAGNGSAGGGLGAGSSIVGYSTFVGASRYSGSGTLTGPTT